MPKRELSELASGYSYLEGLRWHEDRLWASDFYTGQVIAVDLAGKVETICHVPEQPSGLGWLPDGRLLISSMKDRKVLRRETDGTLAVHADLSALTGGHINDMVVDAEGRAYVGNFGFDLMAGAPVATTTLVKVDTDGVAQVVADGLCFPNGSFITADGKTMIVNETFGNRISQFDILANGALGPRRDWANFGALPDSDDLSVLIAASAIGPDGGALDAEGAVWVADAIGKRIVRVARGGQILEQIDTGELGIFAAALGGPDGRTLFMAAAPDFIEANRRANPEGRILMTRVDVPHAGRP
ncbi:SMP-30/gluconolactonase/LRE family protein [Achromobacter piechaudii]|uniref:6-deoxy-6-sulfogluconolactonase n=1 Tax=Achromobacter piechaudii TaxID=72556 RepID=A0ABN7F664_9BURK|nr:SMP-30/gluconolactonase/LRE family protein [Achromobacter piechaudii]CAB3735046.1 6-deoxy-6-sulfogluconolactonase [Achromobacter piechaudii]CAB3916084.1 6-deoxy-6-sulfogluconolactonase [Achromobacter piechaudii]CAB3955508.1 6-deoxy-6-sulfogluconolactonase [Achromobacter piechaudii]